jgi:endonuclease/exonuclease/phosphatase family metal-dependent hydrolase
MGCLYGIEFLELDSPRRGRLRSGGGAVGNAILARHEPHAAYRIALPAALDWRSGGEDRRVPWRVRRRLRREPRIGGRFAIGAEFAIGGRRIAVCSTHLEDKLGGVAARWAQFRTLAAALDDRCGSSGIGVVAGDFNTFDTRIARLVAADRAATALGKPAGLPEAAWWHSCLLPRTGYADPFASSAFTFSVTPLFRAKLDWITVKGAPAHRGGIHVSTLSDHSALWADIDLAGI